MDQVEEPGRERGEPGDAPRSKQSNRRVDADRSFVIPDDEKGPRTETPITSEVRIKAPEAGVVAGLSASEEAPTEELSQVSEPTQVYELPDWADPPTGQVPRILLEDPDAPEHDEPIVRGPSWREDASDWDEAIDLSLLAPDDEEVSQIAGRQAPPTEAPFEFAFDEVEDDTGTEARASETPWQPLLDNAAAAKAERRRRGAHRRRPARKPRVSDLPRPRNALVATATGIAAGGLAVVCFLAGTPETLALLALVLVIAAGEAFAALQKAGYRPATLIGVLAVPALVIGAYLHGPQAIPIVLGLAVLLIAIWFVLGLSKEEPIIDMAVTMFVICWVGVLGAFGGLLLAPSAFPHRHGIAFILAALLLTACHDVGAYATGSWIGKRHIAPRISPGKTLEGLIGATVLVFVVAALGVSHLHPFSVSSALELALIVSFFAPLGDLAESLVKRDLAVKDLGSILPAHGGVLDRIDAMLFVVVPTYYLVRLVHL